MNLLFFCIMHFISSFVMLFSSLIFDCQKCTSTFLNEYSLAEIIFLRMIKEEEFKK